MYLTPPFCWTYTYEIKIRVVAGDQDSIPNFRFFLDVKVQPVEIHPLPLSDFVLNMNDLYCSLK